MAKRPFRTAESIEAEQVTRSMLPAFLEARGFTKVESSIVRQRQTIKAISPAGERLTIWVKLCWNREEGHRDSDRIKTYSAGQLVSYVNDGDWEGTIQHKIESEQLKGSTHLLWVQRDGKDIRYAALMPIEAFLPIWILQRDTSTRLIQEGKLGRRLRNHSQNGTSPTIWLQDDRGGQAVADALWTFPGVYDVAKMPVVHLANLGEGDADDSDDVYTPRDEDSRPRIERAIRARRGQQKFRNALCKRYGNRCVMTGCEILDILEAAHIVAYRGENDNDPGNGLLLRADIHTLFDLGLIDIDPTSFKIIVDSKLQRDPVYGALDGKVLQFAAPNLPSKKALEMRHDFRKRSCDAKLN